MEKSDILPVADRRLSGRGKHLYYPSPLHHSSLWLPLHPSPRSDLPVCLSWKMSAAWRHDNVVCILFVRACIACVCLRSFLDGVSGEAFIRTGCLLNSLAGADINRAARLSLISCVDSSFGIRTGVIAEPTTAHTSTASALLKLVFPLRRPKGPFSLTQANVSIKSHSCCVCDPGPTKTKGSSVMEWNNSLNKHIWHVFIGNAEPVAGAYSSIPPSICDFAKSEDTATCESHLKKCSQSFHNQDEFFQKHHPDNDTTCSDTARRHSTLTAKMETNKRKQELLLVFDREHNGAAQGFGLNGRVEKSLGRVLGVLDGLRHQSVLFGEREWAYGVKDIRQAGVTSLGGLRFDEWNSSLFNVDE